MINSVYNLLFRCRHRHTSFPLRPQTKKGEPPGELYVVCLDCGKRFFYDWELMRMGAEADEVAAPNGSSRKSRFRYIFAACALPVLWLIGKSAITHTRPKTEKKSL